jgi:hypothetical protein
MRLLLKIKDENTCFIWIQRFILLAVDYSVLFARSDDREDVPVHHLHACFISKTIKQSLMIFDTERSTSKASG